MPADIDGSDSSHIYEGCSYVGLDLQKNGIIPLPTIEHPAPVHANNEQRLSFLWGLDVLDQPRDDALDRTCRSLARFVGAPIACLTLVDESRTFVAGSCSFSASEVPREESICTWSTHREETTIISDTQQSAFRELPLVRAGPLRFYASAPLVVRPPGGPPLYLGALCVIADAPRQLSPARPARPAPPRPRAAPGRWLRLGQSEIEALEDMRQVALQLLLQRAERRRVARIADQQECLLALQQLHLAAPEGEGDACGGHAALVHACARTAREALGASSVVVAQAAPGGPAQAAREPDLGVCFCVGRPEHAPGAPSVILASALGPSPPREAAPRGSDHCMAVPAGRGTFITAVKERHVNCFSATDHAFLSSLAALIRSSVEREETEAELAARAAELRRQEAALRLQERTAQRLVGALEASSEPIAVVELATGAVLFANSAWLPVTGFSRQELAAAAPFPPPGLLPPDAAARLQRALAARERTSFEVLGTGRGGAALHARCRAEFTGETLFLVLEDVRALRSAEEESRSKSRFLSIMSHEIRTPLWGILSSAGLLLERPALDEEARDLAETIQTSGDALLALVNDVLDYSRAEADALALDPRPFDLLELLDASATLVASRLGPRHELACVVEEGTPGALVGDALRLKQIIGNLLANAVKFSEEGAIVLRVSPAPADKAGEAPPGHLQLLFSVEDAGIGIAERSLGRLFRCFSQVDDSATRRYEGSGLGLSIARALVEKMAGRIWCVSKEGVGSTFFFTVTLGATPEHPRPAPRPAEPPAAAGGLAVAAGPAEAPAVLVIDRCEAVREMLASALGRCGARVFAAACAADWAASPAPERMLAIFAEVGAEEGGPAPEALPAALPGCASASVCALYRPSPAGRGRKRRRSVLFPPPSEACGPLEPAPEACEGDSPTALPPEWAGAAAVLRKPLSFGRIRKALARLQRHSSWASPPIPSPAAPSGSGSQPPPFSLVRPRPPALPPPPGAADAGQPSQSVGAGLSAVPPALLRILIVEDNPINQKVLQKILRSAGCERIAACGNGREAVDAHAAAPRDVDLVFMDLHMPIMGGIEATQRILAHAAETGAPPPFICAVTADVVRGVREECLGAGMRAYLSKPFRKAEFEAIVATASAHAAARRPGP